MKLIDSMRLVWRNLWRMKLRTILTSIGVMIGTAAIVSMVSLSIGLQENAVKGFEGFGNLTEMDVYPKYSYPEEGGGDFFEKPKELNASAVQELKEIPGVIAAMPTKRGQADITLGNLNGHIQLLGVDVREALILKGDQVEKGDFLSGSMNEILISADVVQNLRDEQKEQRKRRHQDKENPSSGGMSEPDFYFGGPVTEGNTTVDLVGQTVTLLLTREVNIDDETKIERKEIRARVVGQLEKSDDMRNTALVPLELLNEINRFTQTESGQRQRRDRSSDANDNVENKYETITIKVASREHVEETVNQVLAKGYETYSPARDLKDINNIFSIIGLILGGIAAISLLVATIGIINTMLMSILERTREIGIMKVIGATVYNIRWLFLVESGTIGLIGGLAGLGLASGAVGLVNYLARMNPELGMFGGGPMEYIAVIPMWLAIFAIGFSILIGLIAGLYPAFRASRLSPLEAIRSE